MSTFAIILIIVYVVGIIVAARVMKGWKNPWYEKLDFCLIWPLTLLLYGIHYLHNKL